MKSLARNRTQLLALLAIVLIASPAHARDKKELRWDRVLIEVPTVVYPDSFSDSICIAHGFGDNRGLITDTLHKWPFEHREKFVYDVWWGIILVGFGLVEATKDTGSGLVVLEGKGATVNIADAFLKARDYVRTTIDIQGFYPHFMEQHFFERRKREHGWTIYDHEQGKVVYHSPTRELVVDAAPFVHNWFSLFYYLRALDFAPGDTFSVHCFVHRKDHLIFCKVVERDRIRVPAGEFQCIGIEPRPVGEGRGMQKGDFLHIWLTDDDRRLPVKMKAKLKVGSVTARLIEYSRD